MLNEEVLPPWDESDRLAALRSYRILDTPTEPVFDNLVRLAAQVCQTPMALITLIDDRRQWFKAEVGLGLRETPLDVSICAKAILQPGLLIVPTPPQTPASTAILWSRASRTCAFMPGHCWRPRTACLWARSVFSTAFPATSPRSKPSL